MFSSKQNKELISLQDIKSRVTEVDILSFYLFLSKIPCVIKSPLRKDNNPSFGLYSTDGKKVRFKDLSTHETGGCFDLLMKLWNCSFKEALQKIYNDIPKMKSSINVESLKVESYKHHTSESELKVKIREWKDYDDEYWMQFGITRKWLKYANVYPVSQKIIVKNNKSYVFGVDKLAYAYVEQKENKTTIKLYQPLNTKGYKWCNKHDGSVISLWTKIPEKGERLVICSSLKDALCLWANTGIPAVAMQGEGYSMSQTAQNVLKQRFKTIYILFDNDAPGIEDSHKFAQETGFKEITLPKINNCKDIAELYQKEGKEKFINILKSIIK